MPRGGPVLYRRTLVAGTRHRRPPEVPMTHRRYVTLLRGPALYPVTFCWIAGILTLMSVSAGWLGLGAALAAFGVACVLVVLAVNHHQLQVVHSDLGVVHELVNSQRTAMAERIDALVAALTIAGVTVPDDPEQAKVTQAMRGAKHP